MKLKLAVALGVLCISGTANASLTGVQMNGSLHFTTNPDPTNYWDPSSTFIPATYLNSAGLPVTVGSGIEFGFDTSLASDIADFSANQLTIANPIYDQGLLYSWEMVFTSLTPGVFNGISLQSDSFNPALTYSHSGDVLTVDWAGTYDSFTMVNPRDHFEAVFNIPGPVPEPSTWATMIVGLGLAGCLMRRRRRTAVFLQSVS